MFGNKPIAIKVFIILLFVATIVWILYVFNFKLPKFNLSMKHEEKPAYKEEKWKRDERGEKGNEKSGWLFGLFGGKDQDREISKKISDVKQEIRRNKDSEVYVSVTDSDGDGKPDLKTLLKKKIKEKIEWKKELEPIHHKTTVTFSSDKPTFGISLMESENGKTVAIDENFLLEKAKWLQNKLLEFNIPVAIEWFDIWPSIVQIKIKPDPGVKLSNIENLSNDIALSLKSKSLTIISPIPWTDCVWIQLPNPKPAMVRLGDIISSQEFSDSLKKSSTNLSLWKAIDWSVVVKTLESMPHLLVAWATWSGKSVWVNDFILSLIYQNTPSELKFLMVDPKQVELELYSGIPYLLAPIVTDSDKALRLLKRCVIEMERRYWLLKEKRVKNLEEYNGKIIWEKMYRIVVVIDELADMMMSWNKKEVENCITRIAQKARAIWMHLIVATQRPSVNVITWLIKANIPTRIAFWVVAYQDSMTILWRKWAEDLLGKWDMLYMDPNTKRPIRIQAPYISTPEIEKIITTLKNKYMNWISEDDIYDQELLQALEDKIESSAWMYGNWWSGSWADEELVEQAIQVIRETKKASATLLQRKLNLWFARAARIMDLLEDRWIIGPQEGARQREIYI